MKDKLISKFGMTEKDASELMFLLGKVSYTKDEADAVVGQLDEAIPFEGGMDFEEALIMLCENIKN